MLYGFNKDQPLEFGLYTLGDHVPNPMTKERIPAKQRIKEIIQLGIEADKVGLDFFGVGESHQDYFVSQAHTVMLAAIAQATENITIASASSIVSASDPVRVYEEFATIDNISDGRAEIVAGRASRVGIFDMFGYDLDDYDELYEEKLELLRQINDEERVTWEGKFRPALNDAHVLPRADNDRKIPLWRAVGGSPSSAIVAGAQGIPMFMAHLAGSVDSYRNTIEAYRESLSINGYNPEEFPISTAGWFYLADDKQTALREAYTYAGSEMELTNGYKFPKRAFAQAADARSVMNVGEVNEVIDKILLQYETFGMQRYIAQLDLGGIPFEKQMEMLETIEAKVLPAIKKYTGKKG